MINRYELVNRHNPVFNHVDFDSPLTVGNGELAFTCDCTGMQSFYEEQKLHHVPLCTMSQWGWHVTPVSELKYEYTLEDLILTEYDFNGRPVKYAVEEKTGNEQVYQWLRKNPHRMNLGRIGFTWNGEEIKAKDIKNIRQELKLYEGIIESSFSIHGAPCKVLTACHPNDDILGFRISSPALAKGDLKVCFSFPYGAPDITASDWESAEKHTTRLITRSKKGFHLERNLDKNHYYVRVESCQEIHLKRPGDHFFELGTGSSGLEFSVFFSKRNDNRYSFCG